MAYSSLYDAISSASSLRPLANAAGGVGRIIDTVGKSTNNFFPELGLSENLEKLGGQSIALNQGQQAADKKLVSRAAELGQTTLPPNVQSYVSDVAQKNNLGTSRPEVLGTSTSAVGPNQSQVPGSSQASGGGVRATAGSLGAYGNYLTGDDLNSIFNRVYSDNNQLAADIEGRATAQADREYQTILGILGAQRQDVETTAGEQKGLARKEADLASQTLEEKQTQEVDSINKQKDAYKDEVQTTREKLANDWREMSLQLQSIQRARGAQDSSFAAGQETGLLKDFNQGLRALSTKSVAAMESFGQAIDETVSYYKREQANLDLNLQNTFANIDQWLRDQTTRINGQVNLAVDKKFDAIRQATDQADNIRINVTNQINQQKINMATWLEQTRISAMQAVSSAGKAKEQDALDIIKQYREQSNLVGDLISNGVGSIVQDPQTGSPKLVGKLPFSNEDFVVDLSEQGAQIIALQNINKAANFTSNPTQQIISQTQGLPTLQSTAQQIYPSVFPQQQQPQAQDNGWFRGWFSN